MRMEVFMAGNNALHKAAVAKKDEFYTQLSDIENELRHYKSILRIRSFFVIVMILLKVISSSSLQ